MNETLENIIITTAQLADLFGVSEKYLSELHKDKGLPNAGFNSWPLIACVKWRFEDIKKSYENRLEKAFSEKSTDRLANKNAEYRDILIQKEKRQLLDRTETFNAINELLNIIINSMDGFGINNAPFVVGKTDVADVAQILDESIQGIKKIIAESKIDIDLPEEFD